MSFGPWESLRGNCERVQSARWRGTGRAPERDPKGQRVFGAEGHRYELNAVLPEDTIAAFEREHRIRLPPDYRAFLAELGNGGAGPHYGVFKLGEIDDNFSFKPWKTGEMVGVLERPFPYTKDWNLLPDELQRVQEPGDDYEEITRRYWIAMDEPFRLPRRVRPPRLACALGPRRPGASGTTRRRLNGWSPCTFPDGRRITFSNGTRRGFTGVGSSKVR